MENQLAEHIAAVARVDESVRGCRKDILDLRAENIVRLDHHGDRIDSLERTRDIQKGASKILAGLAAIGGTGGLASYLKFWS